MTRKSKKNQQYTTDSEEEELVQREREQEQATVRYVRERKDHSQDIYDLYDALIDYCYDQSLPLLENVKLENFEYLIKEFCLRD